MAGPIGTVTVADVVLILAMRADSIAGAKYGLPFPVLLRGSFGRNGARLPIFIRASVLLGYVGGALGPVAGIMLANFYLIRRRKLRPLRLLQKGRRVRERLDTARDRGHRPRPGRRLRRGLRAAPGP